MTTKEGNPLVCATCGRRYPSEYYFSAPRLCTECYERLDPSEQRRLEEARASAEAAAAAQEKRRPSDLDFYWPRVDSIDGAKKAARLGFWAAVGCAGLQLVSTFVEFENWSPRLRSEPSFLVLFDVAVYGWVAIGLFHQARSAAIAGLGYYVLAQVVGYVSNQALPRGAGFTFAVLILISFVNGLRGAWAYRRLLRKQREEGTSRCESSAGSESSAGT